MLSKQKTKLNCLTFNLPRNITCPGKTVWCEQHCYAKRGRFRRDKVQISQYRNLLTILNDIEMFKISIIGELNNKKPGQLIRIHSCGDFYSSEYMQAWLDIAKVCEQHNFFAYTRVWRLSYDYKAVILRAETINNFVLWHSVDPSSENEVKLLPYVPARIAWISDCKNAKGPLCFTQKDKTRTCKSCKLCVNKKAKRVVFKKH